MLTELEEQAIEAAARTRHPTIPITEETANPFYKGSPIWSKGTGLSMGKVKEKSHAHFAKVHWALLDGSGMPCVVLSHELGSRFTLFCPQRFEDYTTSSALSPDFHVGHRLFGRIFPESKVDPQYIGVITRVTRSHGDHDWIGHTATGIQNWPYELRNGSVNIGKRQHRGSPLPRVVTL